MGENLSRLVHKALSIVAAAAFLVPSAVARADETPPVKGEPAAAAPRPIPVEAMTARATAVALMKAERWADALEAIGRALQIEPDWPEALILRAGIHTRMAGADSTLEALTSAKIGLDYNAMIRSLYAAAGDLLRYLKLQPDAADRAQVIDAIGSLRARAIAARKVQRVIARISQGQELKRLAEEARRRAEEVRRRKEEAERGKAGEARRHADKERKTADAATQKELERRLALESARSARRDRGLIGYGLMGGGAATGILSIIFATMGGGQNGKIQSGGFSTAGDLQAAANAGKGYNLMAWTFGLAAVALVGASIPVILLHRETGDTKVTVLPAIGAPGFLVSGAFR